MKKLIVILSAFAPALLCSLNLNALEVGEKLLLSRHWTTEANHGSQKVFAEKSSFWSISTRPP